MSNAAGVIFFAVAIPGVQASRPRSLITYDLVPAPGRGVMVLSVLCVAVAVVKVEVEVAVELACLPVLAEAPRRHDETNSWR